MQKIYDFKALTSRGKEIDFSEFQGQYGQQVWIHTTVRRTGGAEPEV